MIVHDKNTLWGMAGGQLEFVSQRIEYREIRRPGEGLRWYPVMVIRFTDHDAQAYPHSPHLIEGKYYELEFPLATEG